MRQSPSGTQAHHRPGRGPPLLLRVTLAGLASLIAGPLAAAPLTVPAIATPASPEHHAGKPIFIELITPNMASAKQFYGSLFGWRFQDVAGGKAPYAEAYLGDAPVAGIVEKPTPPGERRPPAWLNFFATANVDTAEQTALRHGAQVLVAPHDLAGRGREAILRDPQGAAFAILASSSGDPPDAPSVAGTWTWRSLIVPDAAADGGFYQAVFGYQMENLAEPAGGQHLLLSSDDVARASLNGRPAGSPDMAPHWLGYVCVDDVTKTAAKISTLGGRILVEPRIDRHGGMIAVAADPEGARFGLIDFPAPQTAPVTK